MKFRELVNKFEMLDLEYSLIIEATNDPDFFGFFSPELEGFTGVGHSIEDCLYKARNGMREHTSLLKEKGLLIPPANPEAKVIIQNAQTITPGVWKGNRIEKHFDITLNRLFHNLNCLFFCFSLADTSWKAWTLGNPVTILSRIYNNLPHFHSP